MPSLLWIHGPRAARMILVGALLGCTDVGPSDGGPTPLDGGMPDAPTCTVQLEDAATLVTFPDRALLADDPTTETGVRLRYDPDRYPDLTARLGGFLPTLTEDLAEVDGFGINAEAYFRFGRDFDAARLPETEAPITSAGFVVVEASPRFVPAVVTASDGTLFLSPLTPLPPRSEIVVYVTRALAPAASGCLEPSASTAALLAAPDGPTSAALDALIALSAIDDADDVIAITTYPTQSVIEHGVAIAADIAERDFDLAAPPSCVDSDDFTRCVASFVVGDYRDVDDGVIRRAGGAPAVPRRTYTVPFTVWLPRTRSGPVPAVFFQHGLTSNREYGGSRMARHLAPLGIAVVAVDAVEHGEHPTATAGREPIDTLQAFFGLSLDDVDTRAFQVARLRDNFAQSTFDRLQLVQLLASHPDIDGAEGADLDVERLAFLGVSAGGVMGTQHLALDGRIGAAVLAVPGGRIATLISDSSSFAPLVRGFRPRRASAGDMRRLYPVVQTIVERGDPASWAPTLFGDRVTGVTGRPDVLVGVALDDAVMPNSGTYALGRAIGLPMIEPVLRPQLGFEAVVGPLTDNVTIGGELATAGFLQFDLVEGEKGLVAADHNNLLESEVGLEAWTHFLVTHFEGAAEIRDPYDALGIVRP